MTTPETGPPDHRGRRLRALTRTGGMRHGVAYLVSGPKDGRSARMTQVYDLSDPANPCTSVTSDAPETSPERKGRCP